MLPKAGELHATGKRQELVETAERMLGLAFVLMTAAFIGCWFFAPMLVDIWVARKDPSWAPADTQTCLAVLSILLGAQIVAQPATVLRKTLLGIGNVRLPRLHRSGGGPREPGTVAGGSSSRSASSASPGGRLFRLCCLSCFC